MKIAILLSGHFRTYKTCHISWYEHLYSQYDCDVFLHTWDVIGRRLDDPTNNDTNAIEEMTPLPYTAKELKFKYGLTGVVIENYKNLHSRFLSDSKRIRFTKNSIDKFKHRRIVHAYSMWYKVLKCWELFESYANQTVTNYDFVVRGRPDLKLLGAYTLVKPEPKMLYIPWYNAKDEPMDYYAVGDYNVMKQYCELYSYFPHLEIYMSLENFLNLHKLLYHYIEMRDIDFIKDEMNDAGKRVYKQHFSIER